MIRLMVAALLLAGGWGASGAHAQGAGPCPAPSPVNDTAGRDPDLVIRASARVEEVRFRSEPDVVVRLTGCSVLDTVRVLERRNLPERVQAGVTYRDVFVAVEILGYVDLECLRPALGLAPAGMAPDSLAARTRMERAGLCRPPSGSPVPPRPRR